MFQPGIGKTTQKTTLRGDLDMNATRTMLTVALTSLGLAVGTSSAEAGHQHIENLAHKLDVRIRLISKEVKLHYQHTPQARHVAYDAGIMVRLASHLHGVAHQGGSATHLSNDLHKLDSRFKHLKRMVREIEHDARQFGVGHIHGDTRHLRNLLYSVKVTLNHLHDEVDALVCEPEWDYYQDNSHYGNWGHSTHRSIRFGGKGFSIQIGH